MLIFQEQSSSWRRPGGLQEHTVAEPSGRPRGAKQTQSVKRTLIKVGAAQESRKKILVKINRYLCNLCALIGSGAWKEAAMLSYHNTFTGHPAATWQFCKETRKEQY